MKQEVCRKEAALVATLYLLGLISIALFITIIAMEMRI